MRGCWPICLLLTRRPWSTQEVPLFVSLCCAGLSPQGRLSHNLHKHLRCQEILSTTVNGKSIEIKLCSFVEMSPKNEHEHIQWTLAGSGIYWEHTNTQATCCNMTGSHVSLSLKHQTSVHFVCCSAAILLHHAVECSQCSIVSPPSAHTSQRTHYIVTMVAMWTGAWQTHSPNHSINQPINQPTNQSITCSLT